MPLSLKEHLDPARLPKRILSLDGGGTLGIIEIAFLEKIESMLASRAQSASEFRLCDYFDLIGGTSTGAIIATALALGMSAAEIKDLYLRVGKKVFRRSFFRLPGIRPRFNASGLNKVLSDVLGERPLQSPDLKTGLAIIAKRLDTGSPWVLTNNPRSKFWDDPDPDAVTGKRPHIGNKHYKLREIVRASTAAPYYFAPERIQIVDSEPEGLFVDGAVSPHNNPALQLFMLAGIKGYEFNWPIDRDKLLLISIGTGWRRPTLSVEESKHMSTIGLAVHALQGLSWDCQMQTLKLLQWLSESPRPWPINQEVGALGGDILGSELVGRRELLTFQRYDIKFDPAWIIERTGLHMSAAKLLRLSNFVDPSIMSDLYDIAAKAAETEVKPDDFPAAFNAP
jgi:Patatin-like phospholipase